jgi:hypothetical protein
MNGHAGKSAFMSLSRGKQTWRGYAEIDANDPSGHRIPFDFCGPQLSCAFRNAGAAEYEATGLSCFFDRRFNHLVATRGRSAVRQAPSHWFSRSQPCDVGSMDRGLRGQAECAWLDDAAHCCAFLGRVQPWLLDSDHFYIALGSGKLSADPFLRFLVDIFCSGPPTVREAIFLTTWTIQHVIDTNPGGVAGPIRIAVLEKIRADWAARELPDDEISEHKEAVVSAGDALRRWRDAVGSGVPTEDVPAPPEPPPSQPPPPARSLSEKFKRPPVIPLPLP